MEMLIEAAARMGWSAVIALGLIIALAVMWHKWQTAKRIREELKDAEAKYKSAVDSGDPDRIHIAGKRLQDARKRAS